MAEQTEDREYQERAKRVKKIVLKDFKAFAKEYFNDAHDTGMTPTEDQAVENVRKRGQQFFERNEDYTYLTAAQQKQVMAECEKEISDIVRAQYRTYVDKYHPEVNGQTPYHVAKSWKKEAAPYAKNINAHVENELNNFLGTCAQKGVCPNEKQIKACIDGWINRYRKEYGPDFTLTEAENLWLRKQIYDYVPQLMKTYHAYADTVKVTNSYPNNYPGVTTSMPPDPRSPKPKLPDGYVAPGKGGNGEPPVTSSEQKEVPTNGDYGPKASLWTKTNVSFSGCDMVVSANMRSTDGHTVSVVIGSLQTVSYSIYRTFSPILNIGNINAKDFVGGPRIIAGSLIFTVMHQHWATELLDKFMAAEGYADSKKIIMDEMAPMDLTISMANEFGVESRLAIYGVHLFNEGQVMSINDIYTENTYQYVALNIDYLANIHTVKDVWSSWGQRLSDGSSSDTNAPGELPAAKGDTSRVESKVPTDEEKNGVTTESPVYHQEADASSASKPKTQANPVHQAEESRQKVQGVKADDKPKDSKSNIHQKIGKEGKGVAEMFSRVSASDDVIEIFDGETLALKGNTQAACSRIILVKYNKKLHDLEDIKNQMSNEQYEQEKERLKALWQLANEKVIEHFNQEFGG